MKHLTCSLLPAFLLVFASGCSSSSTSGGSNPSTSPASRAMQSADDEAHAIMVRAMTMSDEERKTEGPAMEQRIKQLHSQVSEKTRKEIDALMALTTRSVTATESSQLTESARIRPTKLDPRFKPTEDLTNTDVGIDSDLPASVEVSKRPELLPKPREVK